MFQTANQMAQLITSFVDSTSVAELRQGFSSTCICDTWSWWHRWAIAWWLLL